MIALHDVFRAICKIDNSVATRGVISVFKTIWLIAKKRRRPDPLMEHLASLPHSGAASPGSLSSTGTRTGSHALPQWYAAGVADRSPRDQTQKHDDRR
jgi:hypothetical protein